MTDWWQEMFSTAEWFDIHSGIDAERTRREADVIVRMLGAEPGARLLDVPCGQGRHAIELAARGMHVTGVDVTPALLDQARRRADAAGAEVEWVEADMRTMEFSAPFDAAYCYFGSFGYFDKAGDVEFVAAAARALKPGGRFLIETMSAETLLPRFQSHGWHRTGPILVVEERRYDHERGRIESEWNFFRDGTAAGSRHTSIRVYTYHELCNLLRRGGFTTFEAIDPITGAPFALGASRLAIVAILPPDVQ